MKHLFIINDPIMIDTHKKIRLSHVEPIIIDDLFRVFKRKIIKHTN